MENLTEIIGKIGLFITTSSIILSLVFYIKSKYWQQRKLKALKKIEFKNVLSSSDIKVLGNYLDNEIGQMTISDYVDNNEINKRINTFINKLTQFIGTEEQIKREEEPEIKTIEKFEQKTFKEFPYHGKLGVEFDKIIDELFWGESWNALARLRRYIEITLKEIGAKNKLNFEKIYSITQMIDLLVKHNIIDLIVANDLRFPVKVSNKAIHGQDLQKGQAEEAIYRAAIVLDLIKNKKFST